MNSKDWVVWIVDQSLDDKFLLDNLEVVKIKSDAEDWREVIYAVSDEELSKLVDDLKTHLLSGWYAHMINRAEPKVIFKNRSFTTQLGSDYADIEQYGEDQGVTKEQMDIAGLFDQACEEGFF